ncbi:MAG: DegT/DnrJ/EryC1/StrS family aminotransferase [Lachnospiraceae bacterium]|nr:DegT/DnrJ/EryC1/StrS family aminotransferase [Lachnospiraceae bacterium]
MKFISQMEPSFDDCERNALNEYMLAGGWVTEFKKTREFENAIAEYTGASFCSVVSNGTVALSIALMACGVTVGDEVIVPDYTMVATPNAAELIGAKAVFVDIDIRNLCMDFDRMKEAVTEKTKAVILVSINGRYPASIEQFVDFCKEKNIYLIEDAAQSLGSFYYGKHVGRYGDIGSFSFSAPKIITTGQGGALITDNEELYINIKRIRDFGRDQGGSDHYLIKGWNFKFTDIQAVIGLEQMKKLPDRVKRKKEIGKIYQDLLTDIPGVELIETDLTQTAPWFYDILCEDRQGLMAYIKEKNIGTREYYPALHKEPAYHYTNLSFPVAEDVAQRGLWLPSAVTLTDEEVNYVCNNIKMYYCDKK